MHSAAAFAMGGLLMPRVGDAASFFSKKAGIPAGLQLYTLGDLMTTNPKGTLEKLAAIGYKEMESAGSQKGNYYGFKPKEFAAMVKAAGLNWRSAHVFNSLVSEVPLHNSIYVFSLLLVSVVLTLLLCREVRLRRAWQYLVRLLLTKWRDNVEKTKQSGTEDRAEITPEDRQV